ncbi:MAG: formylglycine-generating enzyme family protein [bacterium]|nr:formylglycine-generating enzyme family protein [bacterium]
MRHVPTFALLITATLLAAGCGGGGDPDPAPVGVVKVFTLPNTLDASWTLTGPAGAVITGTDDARHPGRAAGSWTIVWDDVDDWIRPLSQTRTLAGGDSITFIGQFVYVPPPTTGSLSIDIEPDDLQARWVLKRLTGLDDDRSGVGDVVLDDLPPGPFTVAWQREAGWTVPAPGWVDGLITAGETATASVTYTVLPAWPFTTVRLEAGSFTMGSAAPEPGRETDEGPRHEVTLTRPLLVATTELTNGQWDAVVRGRVDDPTIANQPVVDVTWYQAVEFCNAMSVADGLTAAYAINGPQVAWDPDADGWRLPTEAEWEAFCRAGTQGSLSDGELSRLDMELDPVLSFFGWSGANSDNQVKPVRTLLPNPMGLYDVHGNLLEWCWDRYASATTRPIPRPTRAGRSPAPTGCCAAAPSPTPTSGCAARRAPTSIPAPPWGSWASGRCATRRSSSRAGNRRSCIPARPRLRCRQPEAALESTSDRPDRPDLPGRGFVPAQVAAICPPPAARRRRPHRGHPLRRSRPRRRRLRRGCPCTCCPGHGSAPVFTLERLGGQILMTGFLIGLLSDSPAPRDIHLGIFHPPRA